MARGRKRKHDPKIPQHIDQARIPSGLYFDPSGNGRWYVKGRGEDGKPKRSTVASARAYLSDLHSIAEQRAGKSSTGTIAFAVKAFVDSTEYKALSQATRDDYDHHAEILCAWPVRSGGTFGALYIDRLTPPVFHALIEAIAKGKTESRPGAGDGMEPRKSTANHVLRYARRLFKWGIVAGCCTTNPAANVKQVKEDGKNTMPARDVFQVVLNLARERGRLVRRSKGSCAPYLASLMEIAFRCRLRGIEAVALTDADKLQDGVHCRRVKGSNSNITQWTPELRAAWDEAERVRQETLARGRNKSLPVALRADQRRLFVADDGGTLSRRAAGQAIQTLMEIAVAEGLITSDERFSLHGLKHRGVTDTKGNKGDKRTASGHKSDAMVERYDHELPIVAPAQMS